MSQDRHLEAIAADPDDDAPRLVFADWLLEQGDPWGELIHVECRLEALPRWSTERGLLALRRRDLSRRLEGRLLRPALQLGVTRATTRRGFVSAVELPLPVFMARGEEILRCERMIDTLSVEVPGVLAPLAVPALARMRTLSVRSPRPVPGRDGLLLASSPHFRPRVLTLGANVLGSPTFNAFATTHVRATLEEVRIEGHPVAPGVARALARLPLRRLSVRGTGIDNAFLAELGELRGTLEALNVSDNPAVKGGAASVLAGAGKLATLMALRCGVSARDAELFADPALFPALAAVNITGSPVHDDGAAALARAGHLAELGVGVTLVSVATLRALFTQPRSRPLRALALERAPLDASLLAELVRGPHGATLGFLDLTRTGIHDGAVVQLARLGLPALEQLHLGQTPITPAALQALLASARLPALWRVHTDLRAPASLRVELDERFASISTSDRGPEV